MSDPASASRSERPERRGLRRARIALFVLTIWLGSYLARHQLRTPPRPSVMSGSWNRNVDNYAWVDADRLILHHPGSWSINGPNQLEMWELRNLPSGTHLALSPVSSASVPVRTDWPESAT